METDSLLSERDAVTTVDRRYRLATVGGLLVLFLGMMVAILNNDPSALFSSSRSTSSNWSPDVPLLGHKRSGKHKDKKSKKDDKKKPPPALETCDDGNYSKRTLKLAYELPFAALFRDNKGQKKYEASSVIIVDNQVHAVCDSSWAISKFGDNLQPFAHNNVQLGNPKSRPDDSGYEAIFYDGGTYYVVRESIDFQNGTEYHAVIEELALGDNDYTVTATCPSEMEFEGTSKGFEGAVSVRDVNNDLIVLGLCEANNCQKSQSKNKDKGNGRLVAMKKTVNETDGSCEWSTLKMIHIPPSAYFLDYSDITIDATGRVAISSQEESQIWIGQLLGQQQQQGPNGLWNVDEMKFDENPATQKTYSFPKNDQCETVYCNIEGIHWINKEMLLAVSDKMKSGGKQDFRCFDKDQSVHVFVLP